MARGLGVLFLLLPSESVRYAKTQSLAATTAGWEESEGREPRDLGTADGAVSVTRGESSIARLRNLWFSWSNGGDNEVWPPLWGLDGGSSAGSS